jgi:UDPglucose--hexose-1-phosphate uridylyltransferase
MSSWTDLGTPHRRFNPLTGETILGSPQRARRPWRGEVGRATEDRPAHDPACHLCPGNQRASGQRNPVYETTFVFDNDFPALLEESPTAPSAADPLIRSAVARGACRVLCFSPRHDLTLAEMSIEDIGRVVETWIHQSEELGRRFPWVQIFENKGEMMGCSDPHPHGQLWATDVLPEEPAKEDRSQRTYREDHRRPLLMDYLDRELKERERVVLEGGVGGRCTILGGLAFRDHPASAGR